MLQHIPRLVTLAQLAEDMGCEYFQVWGDGVEQLATDPNLTDLWMQEITQIRQVFSGRVLMLASWGEHGGAFTPGYAPELIAMLDVVGPELDAGLEFRFSIDRYPYSWTDGQLPPYLGSLGESLRGKPAMQTLTKAFQVVQGGVYFLQFWVMGAVTKGLTVELQKGGGDFHSYGLNRRDSGGRTTQFLPGRFGGGSLDRFGESAGDLRQKVSGAQGAGWMYTVQLIRGVDGRRRRTRDGRRGRT
jgi:hypothetical protein